MNQESNGAVLSAQGLVKSYRGKRVVDGIDFAVRAGEVVGLLGPNGAGKTTSFYMVIGLVRGDEGRVLLNGEDLSGLPMYQRARKGITYLPQEPSAFRGLSVRDNLLAVAETMPIPRQERTEKVNRLLKEFKIAHLAGQKANTLSGGERRRVEIARSLVTNPRFILLDEPFAGIDPLAVAELQGMVRDLKNKGIGVLITDHNVRETLKICDEATIINVGKVMISGTPEVIVSSEVARKFYLGEEFSL
jgi:lipopolysaccharide export system ATP-binding protein